MNGTFARCFCSRPVTTAAILTLLASGLTGQTPHPLNANPPTVAVPAGVTSVGSHGGPAIISNGLIQLGVNLEGHLNVGGGTLSTGRSGTTNVGLRYVPTNSEATAPGCLCEGWGVADAATGVEGHASVATGGVVNLVVESLSHTPTEAISVVRVGSTFRVTHHYRPSPATPNLYEALVTITNISAVGAGDLRYTRGMDWDISPNTFDEFVTIQGTAASPNVRYADNNGFQIVNPLLARSSLGAVGDFVDFGGSLDHGAHFDFAFGPLGPGASKPSKSITAQQAPKPQRWRRSPQWALRCIRWPRQTGTEPGIR